LVGLVLAGRKEKGGVRKEEGVAIPIRLDQGKRALVSSWQKKESRRGGQSREKGVNVG